MAAKPRRAKSQPSEIVKDKGKAKSSAKAANETASVVSLCLRVNDLLMRIQQIPRATFLKNADSLGDEIRMKLDTVLWIKSPRS